MPIEYVLRENRLTAEPDDYMAMVSPTRTVGSDELLDRMLERESTVGRADALSVLENFEESVISLLAEGVNINLSFVNFSCSIKGIFNGPDDSFDPSRHQVVPNANAGKELRNAFRQGISVSKKEAVIPTPSLLGYTDVNTGERNSIVTPGGMGQISGHRLRFDATDEEQGIFFIAAADGSETKANVVGQNAPSTLMFLLPPGLTSGEYTLEVRAKMGENLRSGSLNETLSVA